MKTFLCKVRRENGRIKTITQQAADMISAFRLLEQNKKVWQIYEVKEKR